MGYGREGRPDDSKVLYGRFGSGTVTVLLLTMLWCCVSGRLWGDTWWKKKKPWGKDNQDFPLQTSMFLHLLFKISRCVLVFLVFKCLVVVFFITVDLNNPSCRMKTTFLEHSRALLQAPSSLWHFVYLTVCLCVDAVPSACRHSGGFCRPVQRKPWAQSM